MDARQYEELASRWVAGDPLAPDEEQLLLEWLENRPNARTALMDDETLDSLLHSWACLDETAEDFVQDCLRGIADAGVNGLPAAAAVGSPSIAAPPVVAPPIVVRKPRDDAGRVKSKGGLFAGKTIRWATVAAACCAVLLVTAIGWRWVAGGRQPGEKNQLASHSTDNHIVQPNPPGAFVTLAKCSAGAAWETPHSEGDRLAVGELKLAAGTVELHFDKGTVCCLAGPATAELRSADEVFLKYGSVSARVPPPAVGFAVATPLARIVDLGTEFDVCVKDAGVTETLVRRGRISLGSQNGQESLGSPIELVAGSLDRATVSVHGLAAEARPVTTVARGSDGRFLGRMTVQSKTAEFHSRAAFDAFRVEAFKQLGQDPGQFANKWAGLADAAVRRKREGSPPKTAPINPRSEPSTAASRRNVPPAAPVDDQTVEVEENGKKVSITDSKDSGITVTITESVNGNKKTTKVRAADTADLAQKNPEAHRFYRKYFHPRPKNGKSK